MQNLWVVFYTVLFGLTIFQPEVAAHLKNSRFENWVPETTQELEDCSRQAHTSFGPIEYVRKGEGPVVLSLQGAFGGWDQSLLISSHLLEHGFSVLAVSRPGYLGTPLSVGMTNEQQADALAALLEMLHIPKVAVLGFSAGAPVAFQLALRHPEKVSALVLESIGAQSNDTLSYIVLELLLNQASPFSASAIPQLDFAFYMLYLTMRFDFYSTAKEILPMDNNLFYTELNQRMRFVVKHANQSEFLRKMIYAMMPLSPRADGIANDIGNAVLGNWPLVPSFYQGIATPTIIVQALNDTNGNYSTAQYVNSQIAGSQLLTVQDSGHFIWLGPDTKAWEKQLVSFLRAYKPPMP